MPNEKIIEIIQHLIGTRYVPTVKAYISELCGRERVVGPADVSTKEFDTQRINIEAGSTDIITGFHFG